MSSKECRDCGRRKPLTEFWKRKASPDGLALYCKECFGLRNAAKYRKKQAQEGKEARPYRRYSSVPAGMKYCKECGETKPVTEFGSNRSAASGRATYCRPCHNRVMADQKDRRHGGQRNYLLKLRYGITVQQVEHMLARQGGVCVICLRKRAKHVDHGHWTGRVRGMLCFGCNGGLGQFEEDPRCLGAAADYLEFRGPHARGMLLEFGSATLAGRPRRKEEEWWRRRRSAGLSRQSNRQNHLRQRYGLEEADVRRLLDAQGGLCAVCWDVPAEHVDHDHVTGAVRGIACGACNTGMGQLGDDPTSLRRAADYLLGQLVREVPAADGGTRLSFTVPDVDPVTVPLDGWEEYREADGRYRRDAWEVADDHEGPTWLDRCLDEILVSERAISEEYARSG